MSICIYCKENKEKGLFTNKEHVIPQAFGTFQPKNFILNDKDKKDETVCNDCNKKLGHILEYHMATDSFEGVILRNEFHSKKKSTNQNKKRLTIQINEGNYTGLFVTLNEKMQIELVPQIALRKKDGKWDYFLPHDIDKIKKENYILEFQENCLGAFVMDVFAAKALFQKIGLSFSPSEASLTQWNKDYACEIKSIMDQTIKRCIAKIAFNYLAYHNCKEFLLESFFDPIRNYILKGGNGVFVRNVNYSLLHDEKNTPSRRVGHIITLDKKNDGSILAHVTLYNQITYAINLTSSFNTLHPFNITIGHIFNIKARGILPLQKVPQKIILQDNWLWLPP